MKRISLVAALLFLLGSNSQADGIGWKTYTTEDGLISNWVLAIANDLQGNLWVGTTKGVSMFDGSTWTTYTIENGLNHNYAPAIAIDSSGNVWVAAMNGVSMFNGNKWTYYKTYTPTSTYPVGVAQMMAVAVDSNGNVWVGGHAGGISRFDGSKWTTYTTKNGLANDQVTAICTDSQGNVWLSGYKGIISKFDGARWTIYDKALGQAEINSIASDYLGHVWFGNSLGVRKYDGARWITYTTITTNNGMADNRVRAIAIDAEGNVWIGTVGGGINKFDGTTWTTYDITDGLADNIVRAIAIDSQGNVWVGTERGISKSISAPEIALSATSLSFGDVSVGDSGQLTFSISNNGSADLVVSNISSNKGTFTVNRTSFSISAEQNQTVTITFQPTTIGNQNATLRITSNDYDEGTLTLSVSGNGIGPDIALSTTSVNIGEVAVGSIGNGSFTITNEGKEPLLVSSISSDNVLFTVSLISATIATGNSQIATLTFTPIVTGDQSAKITLSSNDNDEGLLTINVTGIGVVTLSGRVVEDDLGLGGVDLIITGDGIDTTVNSSTDGNFRFSSFVNGTHIIVPYKQYYTFSPDTIEVDVSNADITIGEFIARVSGLHVDSVSCDFASQATVDISYESGIPIAGLNLTLQFNHKAVQVETVKPVGPASSMSVLGLDIAQANQTGSLVISLADFTLSNPLPVGEGTIAEVVFRDVGQIEQVVPLYVKNQSASTPAGVNLPIMSVNGQITILPGTRSCDMNGDSKINIADVITFLLLIRDDPNNPQYDRNDDVLINIADVITLLLDIRDGKCPDASVLLASEGGPGPVTRLEGLSTEDISYVERTVAQMNLTPEQEATFRLALYGEAGVASLPKAFSLAQNTPNPFNPATTISYSVPDGSAVQVSLKVYDIRGRLVRILAEGEHGPGNHSVFWDGRDVIGSHVASGVYLYRLQAGDFVQTRKMVLLK